MATLTQAQKEARVTVPTTVVIVGTLEINHPSFTAPLRIVRNNADIQGVLEASAPGGFGGATVTFTAMSFDFQLPAVIDGENPLLELVIDNVGRELTQYLESAINDGNPVTVLYREFLIDSAASPPYPSQTDPALALTLGPVDASGPEIRCSASMQDIVNRPFPNKFYDRNTAPYLFVT